MSSYSVVPATVGFPALEREIIALRAERDTFVKPLENTRDDDPWTFYEGPPTANSVPGTHHTEARVLRDLFPRLKITQGRRADRKAGWDCHGLSVEFAVEKEFGFSDKLDIEAYGMEPFSAKCRESVPWHVGAFAELAHHMGYWVSLDEAYATMTPEYMQSVWWAFKQIFDKGLLQEDYRVAPYCPRCGITLFDHELVQGYEDVTDPSVYVRFPATSGSLAGQAGLLVWITTPWILVSNTMIAAHPDVDYVVDTYPRQGSFAVAEPLFDAVLGEEWTRGRSFKGSEMERWDYQRPFEFVKFPAPTSYVVLADHVTTSDGTGLVHQAPAFGEDDMVVRRSYDLPFVNPACVNGTFDDAVKLAGRVFFKDADAPLVANLDERGLLFRGLDCLHSCPHR